MSRRNRSQATFSLFSFQDIITAVTAIVMLLLLILTLELISRRQNAASADPASGRQAMVDAIAALEETVQNLSSQVSTDDVRPLVERTSAELQRDTEIIREQAVRAAARAAEVRLIEQRAKGIAAVEAARVDALKSGLSEVVRSRERASELEDMANKLDAENQQVAKQLEANDDTKEREAAPGAEIVFNSSAEFDRQAWLLEVSGTGAMVVRLGTAGKKHLGEGVNAGSGFDRWLRGLDRQRDHVLVLVRPSGVDLLEEIWASLGESNVPFGIDLLGEGQAVRDGKAKAGSVGGGE